MLAHLRTEAYPVYRERAYAPPASLSYESNVEAIAEAKRRFEGRSAAVAPLRR
jgi:hypothetical protein